MLLSLPLPPRKKVPKKKTALAAIVRRPGKIMAIAAHPGDALFTMGAAVAQHIHNGGTGIFLSLSLGEKGHRTIPPKDRIARGCAACRKNSRARR